MRAEHYLLFSILIGIILHDNTYVGALPGSFNAQYTFFRPHVALVCGKEKYYFYFNESLHWITDQNDYPSPNCTNDKREILKYCRKVYPEKDIVNIVDTNQFVGIENWCKNGRKKCRGSLRVKPFRCVEHLDKSWQSETLIVPERCLFDFVHNVSKCEEFDNWHDLAIRSCDSHEKQLNGFSMLHPCGLDVFSGVQFVCCPKEKVQVTEATTQFGSDQPANFVHEYYDADSDSSSEEETNLRADEEKKKQHRKDETLEKATDHLHLMTQLPLKQDAVGDLRDMKVLYQALKLKDEKTADTFMKKMITAQRSKKRLEKLLLSLEKDRIHTTNHYKQLLNTKLEKTSATLDQFVIMERNLNRSIEMLEKIPELAGKLKDVIIQFLQSLQGGVVPLTLKVLSQNTKAALLEEFRAKMPTTEMPTTQKSPIIKLVTTREQELKFGNREQQKTGSDNNFSERPTFNLDSGAVLLVHQQYPKGGEVHHYEQPRRRTEVSFQKHIGDNDDDGFHAGKNVVYIALASITIPSIAIILCLAFIQKRRLSTEGFTQVEQTDNLEERDTLIVGTTIPRKCGIFGKACDYFNNSGSGNQQDTETPKLLATIIEKLKQLRGKLCTCGQKMKTEAKKHSAIIALCFIFGIIAPVIIVLVVCM